MKKVFKYVIDPYVNEIQMPLGAEILSVRFQRDNFCMWVLVDPSAVMVSRKFRVYGTGHEISGDIENHLKYIGTGHMDNGLVFHAFEVENAYI